METKQYAEAEVKTLEKGFEAVLSTATKDRTGESINQKGWILDKYLRNPVVLWAHQNDKPPVAKAKEVWVDEVGLKAKGIWAKTPFAKELKYLVENGFINSVSVGFIPVEKGKQELLEFSFVNIPALSEALITSRKQNLPLITKALEDLITFQNKEEKPIEIKPVEVEKTNEDEKKEALTEIKKSDIVKSKEKIKTELEKTLILADKIFETLRRIKTEKEIKKTLILADKVFETLLKIERRK